MHCNPYTGASMQLHEQYRPKCWEEVAGQVEALAEVQAVLKRGWGGRAWWLTGLSGTGKTTIARLIAQEGAGEDGTAERNMSIYRHRDGKYLGDTQVDKARYAAVRQEPEGVCRAEDILSQAQIEVLGIDTIGCVIWAE